MVDKITIPSQYLQPGAISDINNVLGIGIKEYIMVGEQITGRLVKGKDKDAGFAGIIPSDKRLLLLTLQGWLG
jgi:hypothetical protein